MGKRFQFWLVILLGITSTAALCSLVWWEYTRQQKLQFQHTLARSENVILLLEQQIEKQKNDRLTLEEELDDIKTLGLVSTQTLDEWRSKHNQVLSKYNQEKRETQDRERQTRNEITRLERAHSFLTSQNNSLKQELLQIRNQIELNGITRQKEMQHINQEMAGLQDLNLFLGMENQLLQNTLDQHQTQLSRLQDENRDYKNLVDTLQTGKISASSGDTSELPANPDVQSYRLVRLHSLQNTLQSRDSRARRAILVSVIPTIPNGISGTELIDLTRELENEDLLAVILETSEYINKPVDEKIIAILTGNMNDSDKEAAELVLSSALRPDR